MANKKKKVGKERIDKYYRLAKSAGYRARSAFKLIQIAQKYNFFKNAKILIDLCAAPGGWLQVAYKNMNKNDSIIIGVDLVPIRKIDNNVITIRSDITTADCVKKIKNVIHNEKADVILNDGAPNVGTTYSYDSLHQNILVLSSIKLVSMFLRKNGVFVTKVFRNEEYISLIWILEKMFGQVKHIKPRSSRDISAEIYIVALNYLDQKIDNKYFDYNYIFSDQFKNEKDRDQAFMGPKELTHGLMTSSMDDPKESKEEEAKRLRNKNKKGIATILKEQKKKRRREGYEIGDDYSATDVANFIISEDYVDMLVKNNKFTFDNNYENNTNPLIKMAYKCIHESQATTKEILYLCEDLKVLGKPDLMALIKWRRKINRDLNNRLEKQGTKEEIKGSVDTTDGKNEEEMEKEEEEGEREKVVKEKMEESSDTDTEAEADNEELKKYEEYLNEKQKKEEKKKRKKEKKILQKSKMLGKQLQIDQIENEIRFNQNTLKLLNEQSAKDYLKVLNDQDDQLIKEDGSSESENEDTSKELVDNFTVEDLENLKKMDKYEALSFLADVEYKLSQKKRSMPHEKKEKKKTRKKRAMEYKEEELMKIQKLMDLKNEELLMKNKLEDILSDGEEDEEEEEEEEEEDSVNTSSSESEQDLDATDEYGDSENERLAALKRKEQAKEKETKYIQQVVAKILQLRRAVKEEERKQEKERAKEEGEMDEETDQEEEGGEEKEEANEQTGHVAKSSSNLFFDQKIFQNIFSQLDSKKKSETKNTKKEIKKSITDEESYSSDGSIKEIDERSLPHIPLPEKLEKKRRKKQLKEKFKDKEVKTKNVSFAVVKSADVLKETNNTEQQEGTIENEKEKEQSENLVKYFANLVKDEDELAFVRYVGEKLIHKKSRMELIDESFNKNSFLEDEDTLPEWFVKEEKTYRRPIIPVDKSVLKQYKTKIDKITKMPIKKVIEAKMRKKKREMEKMKKIEAQLGKIEKNEDDPFLQRKAIATLARKNKAGDKQNKAYVVCSSKGGHMVPNKKGKGGRTVVKYVDKRLKKDKKASRRAEKKKMGKRRTKFSKGKSRYIRRKI